MWHGCTRFKCIALSPQPPLSSCLNPSLRDLSTTSAPHASITPHRPLRLPRTLWLFTLFTLFPRSTVRVLCVGGVPRALRVRVFAVRRDLLVGRCAEQGHAGEDSSPPLLLAPKLPDDPGAIGHFMHNMYMYMYMFMLWPRCQK